MNVFASRFLEAMSQDESTETVEWTWTPASDVNLAYASGRSTSTRSSTYGAEKDDRSDTDRPNEGLLVA